MDITFKTEKLRRLLHDDGSLRTKWGAETARSIRVRLDDLRAAPTLRDVRGIPALVTVLDKLGRIHVAVQHPHGIFFEPAARLSQALTQCDWARIAAIRVLEIGTIDD
ncbi:MAG: hypothetical protein HYS27_03350 [Deltaproteobacteria bacterium]|nr:hypothetical protein [Deltaproteobacteria bacterium]